ncbi:MAG TPA: glyoxalase superfamily protein [Symbiobacteriaceae bacterium]|nr:glyoxalase superfamily protein [Symbiobacteriaceae bacterium]
MFREAFPILYVADMERSVRFYQGLLGFEKKYQWPLEGTPEYVYLTLGGAGLGISPRPVAESLLGRPVCQDDSPKFELCMYTENVDEACEHLTSSGAKLLTPPKTMPWGERMAHVLDPDGNPIHITGKVKPE